MRTACTLGQRASGQWVLIHDFNTLLDEQLITLRRFRAKPVHDEFQRVIVIQRDESYVDEVRLKLTSEVIPIPFIKPQPDAPRRSKKP